VNYDIIWPDLEWFTFSLRDGWKDSPLRSRFFFELGTLSKPMMHLFEHNIRKNMVCSKDAMLKKTTVLNE
jgi:hypothetical protein